MRFTKVLAAAAITVVGLAGCAVDHSGHQADKPTIRIGYQTFPSGDLIVKNNKWLEQALPDYNIKWTKFDSGADVNTAFIAKELDFGALGSSPVARGLSAPLNIPYEVAFILDVAGENEALIARNGTGINTVADLRGKRIATPFASTAHYSLLAALSQNGLSPNDVRLIDLQPQAILAGWERGDIDAAYTWLPTLDELRRTGKELISSRQLADAGKPTLDLAAVSGAFAQAHPEVVDTWRQQQVRAVEHRTYSGPVAAARGQPALYVTERCVFELSASGLVLTEVAPGIDIERDILAHMDFAPLIPQPPRAMDARIFLPAAMGLRAQLLELPLEQRFTYDPAQNLFFINFEGYHVARPEQIEAIRRAVEARLGHLGRRVDTIVNYDDFSIAPELLDAYIEMVRDVVGRFYSGVTRYTTNAFLRMKLGRALSERELHPALYGSREEARAGLASGSGG